MNTKLLWIPILLLAACGDESSAAQQVDGSGDVSSPDGSGDASDSDGAADAGGDATGEDIAADSATADTAEPADTSAPPDTTTEDTSAPGDTAEPPDTTPPADTTDTSEPVDTEPADTEPVDTEPADTSEPADTTTTDTTPVGPPPALPTGPGPLGFNQYDESATVAFNGSTRTMDVRILVPANAADAPFPVVIVSHGFQLSGTVYNTVGERLASHGIIAIIPSYGDNMLAALSHTDLAELTIATVDWALVQSSTGGSRLFSLVDVDHIGLAGHSRGGKQSILATIMDPRVDAVFGIDPVDAGPPFGGDATLYPSVTPEMMGDLNVPAAFLGAGHGGESMLGGLFPACAPTADNYHEYYTAASSPAFEYLVVDGGHLDFTDNCGLICSTCAGGSDASVARNFAAATATAFFKVYLAGDERYRPWVNGGQVADLAPEITFTSK